ncbi:MAG TPA: 6-pyruvoyl-tetrahydropterin synthase-related protein [Patescibacteria group bacterium]|nr:6-pyruvoyl-tetrahydropterin synthase-related protein [Patescibacteria group bacterium]
MVQKLTKLFSGRWAIATVLTIFAIPAVLRLLLPGFYEPHDLHHFADIYQMFRAFSSGQIPPRWGPDFLYNFGYPLFNFYYVMPFYLGALFLAIGGSIQLSFKLIFVSSILIGVAGMYFLLRQFTGKFAAVIGTLIFLYTPYRAVQIYVRGAIGEALSLALLPLVAYVFIKVVKSEGKLRNIAAAGIVGAIFILSHNYMWVLSLPWIIVLALLFAKRKNIWLSLKSLGLSAILMLGVSAFWWVPAIVEQKLVAAQTPFPLIDHFPFIKQLIIPFWGHGPSITGPYDGLSFQIGIINLLGVFVAGIMILFFKKAFKDKKLYLVGAFTLASFFVTIFMMNIRSYPIWRIMPFHDFVQFPWRLLSFTTLFSAILIAITVELWKKNFRIIFGLILIAAAMFLTYNYFQPSGVFYKSDDQYLSRFFAYKNTVSQDYKNYSEDYLLLPRTSDEKPNSLPDEKITSIAGEVSDIKEISPINWSASVSVAEETQVTYNTLSFPGWYASVDGNPVDIVPGKPYGQIEIKVPQGTHKVNFYWRETPLRRNLDLLSAASLLISLIFVFRKPRATL